MSTRHQPDFSQFTEDELARTINVELTKRPELAAAIEDAAALQSLLDELIRLRRQLGMTQTDVAGAMGVRQPTVSQFETESSDPRISTLQRYARAIGSQVSFSVTHSDSLFLATETYRQGRVDSDIAEPQFQVNRNRVAGDWAKENARTEFSLAA